MAPKNREEFVLRDCRINPLDPMKSHFVEPTEPTLQSPALSVIIASFNSSHSIGQTLESLTLQECDANFEIIVVDSSDDVATEGIAESYPRVRLIRAEGRRYPGEARNIGVSAARGNILAFTDADCIVNRDWVKQHIILHESGHSIIGGMVDNGNPDKLFGWVYYFCKFSLWLPGKCDRYVDEIPTTCLSMKREIFSKYGPFAEKCYGSDGLFQWRASRTEGKPFLSTRISVRHQNFWRVSKVLGKLFHHGRDYAMHRASNGKWSATRAFLYAASLPLLPLLLHLKFTLRIARSQVYFPRFLVMTPLVLVGFCMWAVGESVGYIFYCGDVNE
jgi:glycosyltransferase involved in cell wall biosynthesis